MIYQGDYSHTFLQTAPDKEECEAKGKTPTSFGIDLDNCTGFAIEENEFMPGVTGRVKAGIRVKDSKTRYDLIYKNTFYGLSYGNFAEGMNRKDGGNDLEGLEYQCNINSDNNVDFKVTGQDLDEAMIRGRMGEPNLTAGNTFSTGATWHFTNEGHQDIKYYYCDICPPDQEPIYYCVDPNSPDCYFEPIPKSNENGCPSHYGGGGSGGSDDRGVVLTPEQKQQTEQEFAANLADYNNVKALFDNLKDGGNTDATINDVETAWPDDMWELRSELLGKSPHLSMEVLKATADKTDVLPDNVIFEIMAANPDELKKEELIKYLENKDNPLPDYMIDILRQLAGGVTYKTILLNQISDYYHKKVSNAQDIIRSILNDSIIDYFELRNWLDNIGGIVADKQIISTYLQEGDYGSAQNLLDMIPYLYGIDGDVLTEYNDYKSLNELLIIVEQQGRTVFELDSIEINSLMNMAEYSSGNAKYGARAILEYAYGFHYCDCASMPDSIGLKSSKINYKNLIKSTGIDINAKPNPASIYVAFKYKLPANASALIRITDINGKEVKLINIYGEKGQKIWDTRKVKPGVYIYSIESGGISKKGKLVIK